MAAQFSELGLYERRGSAAPMAFDDVVATYTNYLRRRRPGEGMNARVELSRFLGATRIDIGRFYFEYPLHENGSTWIMTRRPPDRYRDARSANRISSTGSTGSE